MKNWIVVAAFAVVVAWWVAGLTESRTLAGFRECRRIPVGYTTVDMVPFGDYLIGVTADGISMYYKHLKAFNLLSSKFIAIDPRTSRVKYLKIIGFPEFYNLNACSVSLLGNNTMYVLSHGYSKGGEMLFIFTIEERNTEIEIIYVKHLLLNFDYGTISGIAVINSTHLFVTKSSVVADDVRGRSYSFFASLQRFLFGWVKRLSDIQLCEIRRNYLECETLARNYLPNGILIAAGQVFVADSIEKSIMVYNFTQEARLDYVSKVYLAHGIEKLSFHNGEIFATGPCSFFDTLMYAYYMNSGITTYNVIGGVTKISYHESNWSLKQLMVQDILSFPTQSSILHDMLVVSSIIDPSLLICRYNST